MHRSFVSKLLVPALSAVTLAACGSSETTVSEPQNTAVAESSAKEANTGNAPAQSSSAELTSFTAQASAEATTAPAATPAPANLPPLPKMRVLVIGDSFAQALGVGLRTKEESTGIKFLNRGEQSTFIPEWAGPLKGVAGMMAAEKPNLVIIALGGNELAMVNPDVRGPKVKQLVGLIGNTPCVWISPPLWEDRKDNGLLGVIRKNSAPCRYYDSDVLSKNLPRGGDKIHPSSEGQKIWAGQVLDWLQKERSGTTEPFALKPRPANE